MTHVPMPQPPSAREEVIEILARGLCELVMRGCKPDQPRDVDAEAGNAINLGIEPGVVVAEEADLRADTSDQVIEPLRFASPAGPASMSLKDHSGRRVMNEQHIDSAANDQGVDLVTGVVPLPVSLKIAGAASIVGRPKATAQATDRVGSGQMPKSPTWSTHAKRTPSDSSKARTSS